MRNSVAVILLCLAACGEMRWQKAGGDEAGLANDLSACSKQAHERSARMWGPPAPRAEISPVFGPTGPSQADLRLQESQAVTLCMRERGYTLVPASETPAK
jgi:hypothetical protein